MDAIIRIAYKHAWSDFNQGEIRIMLATGARRGRFSRAAATIALASIIGVASSASMAAIVDSGPISLSVPSTIDGLYLNFVTGASASTPAPAGWDFDPYNDGSGLKFFTSSSAAHNNQIVGSGTLASVLPPGTVVGPASAYATAGVLTATGFLVTATQYVGVRFTNEATTAINYGYVQLQTTAGSGFPVTIVRYVYENTGAAITIPGAAPVVVGVVSRKVHGAAGTFDLPLSAVPTNPTTEPRTGPDFQLVFTFDKPLAGGAVNFSEGTIGGIGGSISGADAIINVTAVPDAQYITVNLVSMSSTDGGTGGTGSIRVGLLFGDVNQSRAVSIADLGLVNQQLAQPVTAANYLKDINVTGTLTLADKGITNANLTHALPPP